MKQDSTKNMMLSHLEDIKAKIGQKSINNIKLPFKGPFKDNTQADRLNASYVCTPSDLMLLLLVVVVMICMDCLFPRNVNN